MTTSTQIKAHALTLRQQREEYLADLADRQARSIDTWEAPANQDSAWERFKRWFDSPVVPQVEKDTKSNQLALNNMQRTIANQTAELQSTIATQSADISTLHMTIADQTSALAGQAQELAQLRQAILVLAKSAKQVELNTSGITNDLSVIKQQTAVKVLPWKTVQEKIDTAWREIINDTAFLQLDCDHITRGRSAGTFLSFGTRAPETIKTQKREVEVLIKSIKSQRAIIEQHYEHACKHYPDDITSFMKEMPRKLTINDDTRMAPTQSWTISEIFSLTFIEEFRQGLYARRGV